MSWLSSTSTALVTAASGEKGGWVVWCSSINKVKVQGRESSLTRLNNKLGLWLVAGINLVTGEWVKRGAS